MSKPLLVIHGVSNHTPDRFDTEVGALQRALGSAWRAVKVFWGDLGAKVGVDYAPIIPSMVGSGVRSLAGEEEVDPRLAAAILPATLGTQVRSVDSRAEQMVAAATTADMAIRGEARTDLDAAIAAAIREEAPRTTYLSRIDNETVLAAVGQSVGDGTRRGAAGDLAADGLFGGLLGGPPSDGGGALLGAGPAVRETRGLIDPVKQLARSLVHDADRIVGAVLGEVLGDLNQAIRRGFVDDAIGFIGDIFVYEHLRPLVQERIWQAIESDPELANAGWGRDPKRPVHLAGHSLGGVIAFHAATAADTGRKLYLDGLVTFGSQAPMFHLMDPTHSGIPAYKPGNPVPVGDGIRRWTNLWEPMDPLAFIAARVFQLGTADHPVLPTDMPVTHLASYGLWTHSAYWQAPELLEAITATMA